MLMKMNKSFLEIIILKRLEMKEIPVTEKLSVRRRLPAFIVVFASCINDLIPTESISSEAGSVSSYFKKVSSLIVQKYEPSGYSADLLSAGIIVTSALMGKSNYTGGSL